MLVCFGLVGLVRRVVCGLARNGGDCAIDAVVGGNVDLLMVDTLDAIGCWIL